MNAKLGDHFPEQQRKDFSNRNLRCGAVLRKKIKEITPPKIKRFLIIGINQHFDSVATLYFNTDPAPNPYLKSLQYFFIAESRKYLDHDCYLDCAQLHELCLKDLKKELLKEQSIFLDLMSENDLALVFDTVKNAKTISKAKKQKYGLM